MFDTRTSMTRRFFARSFNQIVAVLASISIAQGVLSHTASATTVQTDRFRMTDGGIADFGNGGHSFAVPNGNATVTWDFTPNASGIMIARATVDGTLYLDNQVGGAVRLIAQYRSDFGVLATREIGRVDAGFALNGAADPAHQDQDVNDSLSNSLLTRVDLVLQERQFGTFRQVGSTKVLRVSNLRTFPSPLGGVPVIINNSVGRFVGSIQIRRTNGDMTASVSGSVTSTNTFPPLARLRIDSLDINNNIIGTTAQGPSSSFSRSAVSSAGRLWKVRLSLGGQVVGSTTAVSNASVLTFDFVGNVSPGTFELEPADAFAEVREQFNYAYTWTVPDPQNWHDLQALKLRILDGSDTLISVYFDEAAQTFALFDEETGDIGQAYRAGTNKSLQTPDATLHLRQTRVEASGPTSPSVTLVLSLSFKSRAAETFLSVEVAATDDQGNHGDYQPAGSLEIR